MYQAGTLSGNPLAVTAGLWSISGLSATLYRTLDRLTKRLGNGLLDAAKAAGVPLQVNRVGSMITPFFTASPVTDYASATKSDTERFGRFHRAMLAQGIYLPASQYEAWFLSAAHTERHVNRTIAAARDAFADLRLNPPRCARLPSRADARSVRAPSRATSTEAVVTHRSWWLAGCIALVVSAPGAVLPVTGQSRRQTSIDLSPAAVPAGEQVTIYLTTDAPSSGEPTVLLDGLGVLLDGFVLRMTATTTHCPPPEGCRPCPAGRRCFYTFVDVDSHTAPGRHELPLTISDGTGTSRTPLGIEVLPARDDDRDGLPDAWERLYFGRFSPDPPESSANDDPDGDGMSNIDEFRRDTNPRARYYQYFAEGSSGDRPPAHFLYTRVTSLRDSVGVWVRVVGDGGRRRIGNPFSLSADEETDAAWGSGLDPQHQADRVVALVIESTGPAAAERAMAQFASGQGWPQPYRSVATAPSARWYFADGGTDGTLDTFYLTYNPTDHPVDATITYRLPNGQVARRSTRTIEPGTRTTIWVNVDDALLGRVEASAEIGATAPIVVERAWRFNPPGRTVTQPLASPGTDRPSTRWIFPEVDGDAAFETTIVVANPGTRDAIADVSTLYATRAPLSAGQLRIPAGGRVTVPARQQLGLAGVRATVEITSVNGVALLAERTFSGRDAVGSWRLATVGARAPATRWVLPQSTAGTSTDLILTNFSAFDAKVELRFPKTDSYVHDSEITKIVTVPARRRLVYPLGTDDPAFPWTPGTVRATSQSTGKGVAEIAIEAMSYGEGEFGPRTRASGLVGIPIP